MYNSKLQLSKWQLQCCRIYDIFLTNSFGSVIIQLVILTLYLVKEFVRSGNALSTSVGVPGLAWPGQDSENYGRGTFYVPFYSFAKQNNLVS